MSLNTASANFRVSENQLEVTCERKTVFLSVSKVFIRGFLCISRKRKYLFDKPFNSY